MKGIPVLMYHALEDDVHPAGALEPGEQIYILHVDKFREQMRYLYENGFQTFLLQELSAKDIWPEKVVVITFDDGHESNYTLALPILQEFGFKAEFFITTGWIGREHFLEPYQIRALNKAGMVIGSHGVTHVFFDDLSKHQVASELRESRDTLAKIIGGPIRGCSAPGGRMHSAASLLARDYGYHWLCTSRCRDYKIYESPYAIPRFAMKADMPMEEFSNFLKISSKLIIKVRFKIWLLHIAKKVLGNVNYNRLRYKILTTRGMK